MSKLEKNISQLLDKYTKLEAERDKLKAELESIKRCPQCKVKEGEFHNEYCCLLLAQKRAEKAEAMAGRLAEALRHMTVSGQLEIAWYKWRAKEAVEELEKGKVGKS